jgi:uncharacterized membrane protein YecN with MAPEG domain
MTKLEIAAFFSGINVLILLVTAFRVSLARRANKISLGHGDNPAVLLATRVHGNAAEYIPPAMAALLFMALLDEQSIPLWTLYLLGGAFTLGRLLHAYGLSTHTGPPPGALRPAGMMLTYASLLGFAAALIWGAVAPVLTL